MRIQDFLNFDTLIAGKAIRLLYWLGIIIIVLFAFGSVAGSIRTMGWNMGLGSLQLAVALVATVFGIILWRLTCEFWLVFFAIDEKLARIEKKLPDA